jgi:protein gp37
MACRLAYMKKKPYHMVVTGVSTREDEVGAIPCYDNWRGVTAQQNDQLEKPLHWRKPRKIFVCSMGDLFHESVPFEFIDKVFAVMALCPQHTFQVLTKRAERMKEYLGNRATMPFVDQYAFEISRDKLNKGKDARNWETIKWPLPNVWLGVTAENQEMWDLRWPYLRCLAAKGWKVFISIEPMLSEIDMHLRVSEIQKLGYCNYAIAKRILKNMLVICGGESGSGARPMHPDWARSLRDQCEAAGVPFYFKQWGKHYPLTQQEAFGLFKLDKNGKRTHWQQTINSKWYKVVETDDELWAACGKKKAGHLLDGVEHRPEF